MTGSNPIAAPRALMVVLVALLLGCGRDLEDELRRDLSTAEDPVTDVRCAEQEGDYVNCVVVYESGVRQTCVVSPDGDDGGGCTPAQPN